MVTQTQEIRLTYFKDAKQIALLEHKSNNKREKIQRIDNNSSIAILETEFYQPCIQHITIHALN